MANDITQSFGAISMSKLGLRANTTRSNEHNTKSSNVRINCLCIEVYGIS